MDKPIDQEQNRLVGPFTAQQSGMVGYRIVGGDGTVAIWATGEKNARCVAELLNLAWPVSPRWCRPHNRMSERKRLSPRQRREPYKRPYNLESTNVYIARASRNQ